MNIKQLIEEIQAIIDRTPYSREEIASLWQAEAEVTWLYFYIAWNWSDYMQPRNRSQRLSPMSRREGKPISSRKDYYTSRTSRSYITRGI